MKKKLTKFYPQEIKDYCVDLYLARKHSASSIARIVKEKFKFTINSGDIARMAQEKGHPVISRLEAMRIAVREKKNNGYDWRISK